MTNLAYEDAKAEAMPRYAEPTWDEMRESDEEDGLVCEDCQWYLACGKREARVVVGNLSLYSKAWRDERIKKAVERAVLLCGVCARRTELVACGDPACADVEERQ